MKKLLILPLFVAVFSINTAHQKESVAPNVFTPVEGEPFETITSFAESPTGLGQQSMENNATYSRVSSDSPHSRFVEIKVGPDVASHEIDFWVRQLSEHALFLHLGLEDTKLKNEAWSLHKKFEDFRVKFSKNPKDMKLMNSVLPLIEKLRKFKVKVLTRLESGEWLGWLFPLFVNHTILELDYLVDKLNGIQYTFTEEARFWKRINSEHAAFAAHLLDPQERNYVSAADELSQKFNQLENSEYNAMIQLSRRASKELDEFNKKARAAGNTIKSVIHPVLLDHVIREGERSISTLENMGNSQNTE